MNIPHFQLHEATSLSQAAALMTRHNHDARLLAGGTDLLVDLKTGKIVIGHVVSINRIAELRGVTVDASGLRIGALTTPNQLAASPAVASRYPGIVDATRDMAAPQVRNMATVGGNIASAIPSADLPPIFMALDASVVLWSPEGERTVPLDAFFVGPRQSVRKGHEILTAIVVPAPPPGSGAAYARLALREANACAVAGVAASVCLGDDGTIRQARLAMCAVAPTPRLVPAAAELLAGQMPGEDIYREAAAAAAAATDPISDIRASGEYRRVVVEVLARRALQRATLRAKEATS